jgi:hypothetical protein
MKTLKQKLKHIPSPIREMIVENINSERPQHLSHCLDNHDNILPSFDWEHSIHIPDALFWDGINEEILLIK